MRFFQLVKDGGPESHVWAYVLIESKRFGSIMLLRFEHGTRDAYHSHAFDSWSWVVRGRGLIEQFGQGSREWRNHLGGHPLENVRVHLPGWRMIRTFRDTYHKVASIGRTWVLTVRGPWAATWREQAAGEPERTLAHGRLEVEPEGDWAPMFIANGGD
jgi:hypothetical protein